MMPIHWLKEKRRVHALYVILNLIGIGLEYGLIALFLRWIFAFGWLACILVSAGLFLFISVINIYVNFMKRTVFEETDNPLTEHEAAVLPRLKQTYESLTHKSIEIRFVDGYLMNAQMFALYDKIFINTNVSFSYKTIDEGFFEGVLSHELGHAVHMSKVFILGTFRITTLLAGFLQKLLFVRAGKVLHEKSKGWQKAVFYLGFTLFILLSYQNYLILYPFIRYEEYAANRFALLFTNGYSLRGYYQSLLAYEDKAMRKFDPLHPGVDKQYHRLQEDMLELGYTLTNADIAPRGRIIVHQAKDAQDRNRQIVTFYENCVDHSLIAYHPVIARTYEMLQDMEEAIHYYQLAAKRNHKPSIRRLMQIAVSENRMGDALGYLDHLASMGDLQANVEQQLYEKTFQWVGVLENGVLSDTPWQNKQLIMHLDHTYEIHTGEETRSGILKQNGHRITLLDKDGGRMTLALKDNALHTLPYPIQKDGEDVLVEDIYQPFENQDLQGGDDE